MLIRFFSGLPPYELGPFDNDQKIVEIRRELKNRDGAANEYDYRIFFGESEREIEEDNSTFADVFGDNLYFTEVTVYYTAKNIGKQLEHIRFGSQLDKLI